MSPFDRLLRFDAALRDRYPPLGEFITVGDRRLHFRRSGPSGGTPIVLIHGASGNLRDFELSLLPQLSERHPVIAFDRPGFGYSERVEDGWHLSAQVDAMAEAMAELGHRRYILAGHSYGGTVAMRWVLDRPKTVAGVLALAAPVMDWGGGGLGVLYEIGGRPVTGHVLARIARLVAGPRRVASAVEEIFEPDPVPSDYLSDGGVELALRPRTFRQNAVMMRHVHSQIVAQADQYSQIACPVEIVHGDADTIVPAHIHALPLSRIVPDNQLTILPGVGHMPHHAAPDEVIAAIERLAAHVPA